MASQSSVKMAYLKDVRRVLGDKVVKEMTESCDAETFPSEKLSSFALHLCENSVVYGNHRRRKMDGADELKAILCDWYSEELCMITPDAALERLVVVLEHSDVNVKPLAAKIKNIKDKERDQPGENQDNMSLPAHKQICCHSHISCVFMFSFSFLSFTYLCISNYSYFTEQSVKRKSIKRFIHFGRLSNASCPHLTEIYCCHGKKVEEEDFETAALPCEVLLYENFDYKISFHTEEKKEWKKVEEGVIFHDDTVQHQLLTVGQIRNFPEKDCSDLNEVKMRLEPLRLEPFGPEHPHKVKDLFNEGVIFTERIKPCKFSHNIENDASKGVMSH